MSSSMTAEGAMIVTGGDRRARRCGREAKAIAASVVRALQDAPEHHRSGKGRGSISWTPKSVDFVEAILRTGKDPEAELREPC